MIDVLLGVLLTLNHRNSRNQSPGDRERIVWDGIDHTCLKNGYVLQQFDVVNTNCIEYERGGGGFFKIKLTVEPSIPTPWNEAIPVSRTLYMDVFTDNNWTSTPETRQGHTHLTNKDTLTRTTTTRFYELLSMFVYTQANTAIFTDL